MMNVTMPIHKSTSDTPRWFMILHTLPIVVTAIDISSKFTPVSFFIRLIVYLQAQLLQLHARAIKIEIDGFVAKAMHETKESQNSSISLL